MAMAMAMARTMMKTMATPMMKMTRCCNLAHSGGTHLPVRRWEEEGMSSSKPLWSVEQQEPPPPPLLSGGGGGGGGGILLQDDLLRPAYIPPPLPSGPDEILLQENQDDLEEEPPPSVRPDYESMGLLRPYRLPLEFYRDLAEFRASGRPVRSDGTPAPRWWELKFKKPWRLPPSGTSGIPDNYRPTPPPAPAEMSMVGSNSNWVGRLKRADNYPNYSVQDYVALRVIGIANYFKVKEDIYDFGIDDVVPEQLEYWLDELQGYFEYMELAHELHSIDRLFPLLHHVLVYPHSACIRAKTAELVTTMVHNNPKSQQLVMGLHGLRPLWYNFTSDPDATSRTRALGAISALIWNNKPGITAFREINGYAALGDSLSSESVWFQREALNLIQYLLHENSSDCNTVTELGLPCIMMHLASSDDAEVRVATLRGLLVLARDEGGNSCELVKNDDKLKLVLQELIKRISAMAPEDLVAAREEIQLVDSLWNACYNEPSPKA